MDAQDDLVDLELELLRDERAWLRELWEERAGCVVWVCPSEGRFATT